MAKLTVLKNGAEVQKVDLAKLGKTLVSVGRAEGADIRLDDRAVGREHAVFRIANGGISVQKKTKFGKLGLNGVEGNEFLVKSGDVIFLADYQLRLEAEATRSVAMASDARRDVEVPLTGDLPPIERTMVSSPGGAFESGSQSESSSASDGAGDAIGVALQSPIDVGAPGPGAGLGQDPAAQGAIELGAQAALPPLDSNSADVANSTVAAAGGSEKSIEIDAGGQRGAEPFKAETQAMASGLTGLATPGGADGGNPMDMSNLAGGGGGGVGDGSSAANANDIVAEGDRTAVISNGKIVTKLVFKAGEANHEEYFIRKTEISIGRGSNCDIILSDSKSSRKHLVIRRAGATYVAVDMGSSNGTYVNGVKISQQELAGDDVLRIGTTEFTFKAENQEYFEHEHNLMPVPADDPATPAPMPIPDLQGASLTASAPQFGNQFPSQFGSSGPEMGGSGSTNPGIPFGGTPVGSIPGITAPGLAGKAPGGKETLMAKFKRQPMVRKALILGVMVVIGAYVMNEDGPVDTKPKQKAAQGDASFEALNAEKKQFVMNTYDMAYGFYKNSQYDKAKYEAEKIINILPNGYKDTKDLITYAQQALDKAQRLEEEKRRKEQEEKIRNEVSQLALQAEALVNKGKDDEAKPLFAEIFEKDPDNPTALRLRQIVEEREAKKRAEEEAEVERQAKRKLLVELIDKGNNLIDEGKYYPAIDAMADAPVVYSGDAALLKKAEGVAKKARRLLAEKTAGPMKEAKAALERLDYASARDGFYKVLDIDEKNEEALEGLEQVRQTLTDRSKKTYTEGVIAEGVSDYFTAKGKFKECLDEAMPDDVYFGRCQRKYKRLEMINRSTATVTGNDAAGVKAPVGTDPEKPVLPSDLAGPDAVAPAPAPLNEPTDGAGRSAASEQPKADSKKTPDSPGSEPAHHE